MHCGPGPATVGPWLGVRSVRGHRRRLRTPFPVHGLWLATYHRTHGVRYFHGCCSIGGDTLRGVNHGKKGAATPAALRSIHAARPGNVPIYVTGEKGIRRGGHPLGTAARTTRRTHPVTALPGLLGAGLVTGGQLDGGQIPVGLVVDAGVLTDAVDRAPVSGARGGRWSDRRRVINGMLCRVQMGAQWRDLARTKSR